MSKILSEYDEWCGEYISILKSNDTRINTILTYQNIFEKFREYLASLDISLNAMRVIHFSRYIDILKKRYKPSSISTHYNSLKALFRYISKNSNKDYMILFDNIKIKNTQILSEEKFLSNNDVKKILSYLDTIDKSNIKKAQMSLLFKFGYYFGLRISETIAIKQKDILDDNDYLKITTKNIKKRDNSTKYFFIKKDKIIDELKILTENEYIFFSQKNNTTHITRRAGHQILHRLYKSASVNKSGTHILRHTCAKTMVDKNIHLSTIKDHLGHSNIQTTMIYAKSDDESKKRAVEMMD